MKQCITTYCINDAPNGRYCSKCKMRAWRAKNVIRDTYNHLKHHAAERFIGFEVTWEYFVEFCNRTKYHELKGVGGDDMTIDRPNSLRGYADDNMEMITRLKNVEKQHTVDRQQRIKSMSEKFKSEGAPF